MKANDRVLITGATSGLGREMARQLAARGCRLAITGRREEKLEAAAHEAREAGANDVLTLAGSVTDAEVVAGHYRKIVERYRGLDVAILNAGVGDSSPGREFNARDYEWTFDTNVFGVCHWIEAVLPDMLANKRGVIAGVSSPAGWRGFPGMGSYAASKAAVSTLLESLRCDLRGTGISVVTICPGFVKSEITARNDPKDMIQLLETEDGARRMLRAIDKRKRIAHFPFPWTFILRHAVCNLPGFAFDWLMARINRTPKEPYKTPADEA